VSAPRLAMIGVMTLLLAPLAAAAGCLLVRRARAAELLNLAAALIAFAAVVGLVPLALRGPYTFWGGYLIVDPLGAWVLLSVATVYLLASIYAIGYMRSPEADPRLHHFYALFAGFALTTLVGPLMNNVGVYWIAIELTTLVSTFLVGFERTRESVEAAWKYIVIVSAGISLALLGIVFYYWAGSFSLGPSYDLTWSALRAVAPHLNPTLALAAFLLVFIGFGTKVGLAPMHTWLPDAHSEGPAPVSAMLSGALLNTAMIGIARFIHVADSARLGMMPRTVVVIVGSLSIAVAALFITRQTELKRLMAYSSVEHMGVMTVGFGFGGPLGVAGALYHMLNHSLNKSLMFFGAGEAVHAFHSKRMGRMHHVLTMMPVAGVLWIAGAVAITGAPPFGLFLSEVTILRAGITGPNAWAAFVMLVLLVVIFVGFLNHFRAMYFAETSAESSAESSAASNDPAALPKPRARATSLWCTLPMWLALLPLLALGLWWPHALSSYLAAIAAQLSVGTAP